VKMGGGREPNVDSRGRGSGKNRTPRNAKYLGPTRKIFCAPPLPIDGRIVLSVNVRDVIYLPIQTLTSGSYRALGVCVCVCVFDTDKVGQGESKNSVLGWTSLMYDP